MSNNTIVIERFRTSMCGGASFMRTVTPAAGFVPAAHASAVSYKTLTDARNDAQGGADAWSPPV